MEITQRQANDYPFHRLGIMSTQNDRLAALFKQTDEEVASNFDSSMVSAPARNDPKSSFSDSGNGEKILKATKRAQRSSSESEVDCGSKLADELAVSIRFPLRPRLTSSDDDIDNTPTLDLHVGGLPSEHETFCPLAVVIKYPYTYIGAGNREKAS